MNTATSQPARVVVISKDAEVLNVLCGYLRNTGVEPLPFQDPSNALESLDPNHPPELIITELFMPGLDGWSLCRLLRAPEHAAFSKTPILAVSDLCSRDSFRQIANDAETDALFFSSVEVDEFTSQVQALLHGSDDDCKPRALITGSFDASTRPLQKAFLDHGFQVDMVPVDEAENTAGRVSYNIAVLDCRAADELTELLDKLRANQPNCMYLVLVDDPAPYETREWMEHGASACLPHAITPEELGELIPRIQRERALLHMAEQFDSRTREVIQNRDRLESIVEGTRAGSWVWNVQTGETIFNERWAEIVGYTIAELEPVSIKTWEQLVHPEDNLRSIDLLKRHFAEELPYYAFEGRMRHKDGSWVWVRDQGKVFSRTKDGKPLWMSGSHIDITSIKRSEVALRDVEERYRALFDRSFDCVFLLDFDGHFLDINQPMLDLLGYEQDDIPTLDMSSVLFEDQVPLANERVKSILELGYQEAPHEFKARHRDGRVIFVETLSSLILKDGKPFALQGIGRDITERKKIEVELRKSQLITENIPVGLHLYFLEDISDDRTLRMVYANPAVKQLTGIDPESIVGKTLDESFPELRDSGVPQRYAEVVRSQTAISFEDITYGDDRIPVNSFSVHVFPLPRNHVGVAFENTTVRTLTEARLLHANQSLEKLNQELEEEIAERLAVEQALRDSEQKAVAIFNLTSGFTGLLSIEGAILEVNQSALDFAGIKHQDVIGQPLWDTPWWTHDPAVQQQARTAVQQAAQGHATRFETTHTTLSGDQHAFDVSVTPVFDKSGQVSVLILEGRDIEQTRRAEFDRQRQQQALLSIIQDETVNGTDVDAAARVVTQKVADVMDVPRVGVWLLNNNGSELRCADIFLSRTGTHTNGAVLITEDYPAYFDALRQGRVIDAVDAAKDPRTSEFNKGYLDSNRVTSMLDSPIRVHGKVVGVICIERTENIHHWQPDEISFAGQVADQMAQPLINASRKLAEESIRASEERYRLLAETASELITIWNLNGEIVYANRAVLELSGYTKADIPHLTMKDVCPPDELARWQEVLELRVKGAVDELKLTTRFLTKDGRVIPVEVSNVPIIQDGNLNGILNIARDISDRLKAERVQQQLAQSQKLEAIGTLAGGIAHDFNNILFAIMANTELLQDSISAHSPEQECVEQILQASQRATDLVKQILAFSRRKESQTSATNLTLVTMEIVKLLRPALPASIEMRVDFSGCENHVLAETTQIHQLFMNLCTNAAQSMDGHHGILELKLKDVVLDEETASSYSGLKPGNHVQLTVSDTGSGMDEDTRNRIFEPFFTTKEPGKGTGMGLSVVHGIVAQLEGAITVYSEVGVGTTIHVYLPAIQEQEPEAAAPPIKSLPHGSGRILVVDDEQAVTKAIARMLDKLGYTTTTCNHSELALELFQRNPQAFDLVITDLTMPKQSGMTLARELLMIRPDLPIILCTGFSQAVTMETAAEIGVCAYLAKPVSRSDLAQVVFQQIELAKPP